jgi:hypothetical protein
MLVVPPELNTSGIEPPVENVNVPVWPLRSGRTPKVMAIVGAVPSGHVGVTSMANSPGVGMLVLVDDVDEVLVELVDDVVDDELVVVVAPAVVVGAAVVVVVPPLGGGHSSADGSGWPVSSAMTTERPWASLKKAPMTMLG